MTRIPRSAREPLPEEFLSSGLIPEALQPEPMADVAMGHELDEDYLLGWEIGTLTV